MIPNENAIAESRFTPANCRDGPKIERHLTDFFCCVLYILLVVACVVLGILNLGNSISGYTRPFDYDHNPCRGDTHLLYIPTTDTSKTVCVNVCPGTAGIPLQCQPNSLFPQCPTSVAGLAKNTPNRLCYNREADISPILKSNEFSIRSAFDSIIEGRMWILLTIGLMVALCIILVITTFIVPSIMTYIYLFLFEVILLLISAGLFYRYFRGRLPFVNLEFDAHYHGNAFILVVAILFAVGFIISSVLLFGRLGKIKYIVVVLRVAKRCFWENFYEIMLAFLLSALSIGFLILNIFLLYTAQSAGTVDKSQHQAYNQFVPSQLAWISLGLTVFQALWTHGVLIAMSDFLYQSIAIHWYFGERVYGSNYSRCNNFSASFRMLGYHFGSVCFGAILAYIPEFITVALNHLEITAPSFYNICCLWHRCCCRYLSKYGFSETILQSYSFCPANEQMYYLRKRTKNMLPNVYMLGNFYEQSAKVFVELMSVVVCYLLLIVKAEQYYGSILHLAAPLFATIFVSAEIASHFMNCTGLIGDTLVFMYVADTEIEKYGYGHTEPFSCPAAIRPIFKEAKFRDF